MENDFAKRTLCRFKEMGFRPLQQWEERNVISASENGKTYVVKINPKKACALYQIDGEIIRTGNKCDKLVIVISDSFSATIFIELKGKDIIHAISQLESTLQNKIFTPFGRKGEVIRARIVTGGCGPASSAKIELEKAKIRFLKNYKCDLRVLKSRCEDMML